MKEIKILLVIPILAVALCLSACCVPEADKSGTTETNPTQTHQETQSESTPTKPEVFEPQPGYFPIPEEPAEFSFLSGAGAWRTVMEINTDGTFSGTYLDSEMGTIGEGYPNGSAYICEFSGVFADIEKVNSYTYKTRMINLSTHYPAGKEWIENEIRYIASYPHGLYNEDGTQPCEEFIVYLPSTPVSELPEEFLIWCPYQIEQNDNATLSCYGLLNVETNYGFFYIPETQTATAG